MGWSLESYILEDMLNSFGDTMYSIYIKMYICDIMDMNRDPSLHVFFSWD